MKAKGADAERAQQAGSYGTGVRAASCPVSRPAGRPAIAANNPHFSLSLSPLNTDRTVGK